MLGLAKVYVSVFPVHEPFTLALDCPTCGKPFSVLIQESERQTVGERIAALKHELPCPYAGCPGRLEPLLTGEIISVWLGHGPAPSTVVL